VTGAGDTVVSVVALALAAGADFPAACLLATMPPASSSARGHGHVPREQLLGSLAAARG